MQKIRALVVDDESSARDRVVALLASEPDVELVGQCADGAQAVSAIERLEPELVFLDVQIPLGDGFEVIRAIAPDRMPMFVFTTAYDAYALRAFDVHALDYLLKPFDRSRFHQALARAREALDRRQTGALGERLLAMVRDLKGDPAPPPAPDRIVVRSGGRVSFIRLSEIDWIEAAGNYVRLHLRGGDAPLHRETMTMLGRRLDDRRFLRIHRGAIVNADRIRELQPSGGDWTVVLTSGERLTLSRGYRDTVQERLTCEPPPSTDRSPARRPA